MLDSIFPFDTAGVDLAENVLLHSAPAGLPLQHVLSMKQVMDKAMTPEGKALMPDGEKGDFNLASVSVEEIETVHKHWGDYGMLQLMSLSMSTSASEFEHFYGLTRDSLRLRGIVDGNRSKAIEYDNAVLRADDRLNAFNWNVLNPSLSRKLYRAGRHHGSLVYGLGGPRILVSHPFQGIEGDIYDVYMNSVDVVTSLNMRGYHGTFHFLDYLGGLNYEVAGVPAWAMWFSVIATHSDLVIFVKEYEGDFGPSQRFEMALTPNRVRKKIVELPHSELKWAKKPDSIEGADVMYVGAKGVVSKAEFLRMEAEHAAPFVDGYVQDGFPKDRLIVLRDDRIEEFPLGFPEYDPRADLSVAKVRRFAG